MHIMKKTIIVNKLVNKQKKRKEAEKIDDDEWSDF